jgi:predicted transcriptional regulator
LLTINRWRITPLKRSNFQVLFEILTLCKKPQSEKNLKVGISLPPGILQKCIIQLLLSDWLENLKVEGSKFKYYVTTEKGTVFLEKYGKLQQLLAPEHKQEQLAPSPVIPEYGSQ